MKEMLYFINNIANFVTPQGTILLRMCPMNEYIFYVN